MTPEERQISFDEGFLWSKDNGELPYIETSAKDSTNVENAFVMAVKIWSSLEEKQEKMYDSDTVTLTSLRDTSKSSTCCLKS